MRKAKYEVEGTVTFLKEGVEKVINLKSLGQYVKPTYKGLLNGSVVNNRMLIIEMQQSGIKLSTVFHYKSLSKKNDILKTFIDDCSKQITSYIKANYNIHIECFLKLSEVYDEDYCCLPLDEAKIDLNQEELQEIIQEMSHYAPTVRSTREKRNVFFD